MMVQIHKRTLADRISEMPYPRISIVNPMLVRYKFPYDEFSVQIARNVHGCGDFDRWSRSYTFYAISPEQVQAVIDGLRRVDASVVWAQKRDAAATAKEKAAAQSEESVEEESASSPSVGRSGADYARHLFEQWASAKDVVVKDSETWFEARCKADMEAGVLIAPKAKEAVESAKLVFEDLAFGFYMGWRRYGPGRYA